jgi:hypothetical protein
MKNVTLSAEDQLIQQARALAQVRGTTLNAEFRVWLANYASQDVLGVKKTQTRALLDQLTAPVSGQAAVPADHVYSPQEARQPLREPFNVRELRILKRLDGAPV